MFLMYHVSERLQKKFFPMCKTQYFSHLEVPNPYNALVGHKIKLQEGGLH